jgi:hypothetical protein
MGFTLSFLEIVIKVIVKVMVTALTKHLISRIKERTAPIGRRDGSDSSNR